MERFSKFRTIIFILLLPFLLISCTSISTSVESKGPNVNQVIKYKGPKARIAVASFKCKAAKCNWEIGSGIADMLTTALFQTGKFIVVERSNEGLGAIQRELNLAQSGLVGQNIPQRGLLEGADILVVGAITAFEPKAEGIGIGGLAIPLNVPLVGGLKVGKNEAYIAADIRLIDVRTGRIINTTTVEGKASSWKLGGLGGGYHNRLILGGGLEMYKNTPMEKAIRVMIDNAVKKIAELVPENYYRYTAQGKPVSSKNQYVTTISTSNTQLFNNQIELGTPIFIETFNNYGIGQSVPFGPWQGVKAHIEAGVESNNMIGRILKLGGKICNNKINIKNFILTLDYNTETNALNIYFRTVQNPLIAYKLTIAANRFFELYKIAGSTQVKLAKNQINLPYAKWYRLKLVVKDNLIQVYGNNRLAIEIKDNDPSLQRPGSICLGGYGEVIVDNLKIYSIK